MQRLSVLVLLLLVLPCRGQAVASVPAGEVEFEKAALLSDLKALEALEEAVRAANVGEAEAAGARVGLDTEVFKLLARTNETRVRQAANSLKDRLRRVAALAAVYQWKAKELTTGARPSPPGARP